MELGRNLRLATLTTVPLAIASAAVQASASAPCEHGRLVHSWGGAESQVIACSYGEEPSILGEDRWRASGLTFYRLVPKRGAQEILDSLEANPPIEYSREGGNLIFVIFTYDPRSSSPAAIFRRVLPIAGESAVPSLELVLHAPPPDPARVDAIFSVLSGPRPPDSTWRLESIEEMLFELRNYGLADPQSMSARLQALGSPPWRDGAAAESLSQVLRELALVERAQKERQ